MGRISYHFESSVSTYYYGQHHPMKPHRVRMAHNLLVAYGLTDKLDVFTPPRVTEKDMTRFHADEYVSFLKMVSPESVGDHQDALSRFNVLEDCPVFDGLWEYCQIAAGGSLAGASRLNAGDADISINWAGGLHHAKKAEASGFCYVNDCVLAILELLKVHTRVLYVDIDIHHGDGVEEAFYSTDRVMTASFHKFGGFFPGTGAVDDIGIGRGKNYAVNFPLRDGIDDESYREIFVPVMGRIMDWYQPGAVVLQCGADSLSGDRLGCFNLSLRGHAHCVDFLKGYNVPLLVLGGGGYTIRNVARCWAYETSRLVGVELPDELPYNDNLEFYAPEFRLHIVPSNMENHNTPGELERNKARILEHLRGLPAAPSVQLMDTPRASPQGLNNLDIDSDGDDPDVRHHKHKAKMVVEYEDSDDDMAIGGDDILGNIPSARRRLKRPGASLSLPKKHRGAVAAIAVPREAYSPPRASRSPTTALPNLPTLGASHAVSGTGGSLKRHMSVLVDPDPNSNSGFMQVVRGHSVTVGDGGLTTHVPASNKLDGVEKRRRVSDPRNVADTTGSGQKSKSYEMEIEDKNEGENNVDGKGKNIINDGEGEAYLASSKRTWQSAQHVRPAAGIHKAPKDVFVSRRSRGVERAIGDQQLRERGSDGAMRSPETDSKLKSGESDRDGRFDIELGDDTPLRRRRSTDGFQDSEDKERRRIASRESVASDRREQKKGVDQDSSARDFGPDASPRPNRRRNVPREQATSDRREQKKVTDVQERMTRESGAEDSQRQERLRSTTHEPVATERRKDKPTSNGEEGIPRSRSDDAQPDGSSKQGRPPNEDVEMMDPPTDSGPSRMRSFRDWNSKERTRPAKSRQRTVDEMESVRGSDARGKSRDVIGRGKDGPSAGQPKAEAEDVGMGQNESARQQGNLGNPEEASQKVIKRPSPRSRERWTEDDHERVENEPALPDDDRRAQGSVAPRRSGFAEKNNIVASDVGDGGPAKEGSGKFTESFPGRRPGGRASDPTKVGASKQRRSDRDRKGEEGARHADEDRGPNGIVDQSSGYTSRKVGGIPKVPMSVPQSSVPPPTNQGRSGPTGGSSKRSPLVPLSKHKASNDTWEGKSMDLEDESRSADASGVRDLHGAKSVDGQESRSARGNAAEGGPKDGSRKDAERGRSHVQGDSRGATKGSGGDNRRERGIGGGEAEGTVKSAKPDSSFKKNSNLLGGSRPGSFDGKNSKYKSPIRSDPVDIGTSAGEPLRRSSSDKIRSSKDPVEGKSPAMASGLRSSPSDSKKGSVDPKRAVGKVTIKIPQSGPAKTTVTRADDKPSPMRSGEKDVSSKDGKGTEPSDKRPQSPASGHEEPKA